MTPGTRLRPLALVVAIAPAGCGIFTVRAADVVRSHAYEDLGCGDVVVTTASGGAYQATGCGQTRRYVCDREVATAATKPGALAAVGCR